MIDFKNMLLNGYVNENKYFKKYIIREQKKSEAEHYETEEFFNKCFDVIEGFKDEISQQYYKRKTEIYLMRTLPDFSEEEFKNAMEDLSLYNYSVTLFYATNGRFTGHLFYGNVIQIEEELKEACKLAFSEKETKADLHNRISTPDKNDNPYPKIFTSSTGYAIFKRLHEVYKEEKTVLANYSFLYEALRSDKFVFCEPSLFIRFLSEEFQIDLDKIDSRQAGTNKKTTGYEAIKSLYSTKAQ